MAGNLTLRVEGSAELRNALATIGGRIVPETKKAVGDTLVDFNRAMSARLKSPGADGLARRSGRLMGSLHTATVATESSVSGVASIGGAGAPYAPTQEVGGIIRPKNHRYMAIPFDQGLTAGGKRRWNDLGSLNVQNVVGRTGGTFVKKGRNPSILEVFQRPASKSGKPNLVALLVRAVKIPARLGFFKTWRTMEPALNQRLAAAVDRAVKGGGA